MLCFGYFYSIILSILKIERRVSTSVSPHSPSWLSFHLVVFSPLNLLFTISFLVLSVGFSPAFLGYFLKNSPETEIL
ncbi:hypothetical protein FHS90_000338 [Rufibacter quisquiliarum]|uniref:Uncharacterized protein n=1 Tax=Rufibacter quisquiliarum TaxID=1549639 RepID=A0A839GP66_9BACT|nr:hypothetical protein [Rufibacter quisquiliarum]